MGALLPGGGDCDILACRSLLVLEVIVTSVLSLRTAPQEPNGAVTGSLLVFRLLPPFRSKRRGPYPVVFVECWDASAVALADPVHPGSSSVDRATRSITLCAQTAATWREKYQEDVAQIDICAKCGGEIFRGKCTSCQDWSDASALGRVPIAVPHGVEFYLEVYGHTFSVPPLLARAKAWALKVEQSSREACYDN